MANCINKVTLLGRLGQNPEIKSKNNADKVAILSLATSEGYKDKTTGDYKENTEWHRVVVYNDRLVEVIEKYLNKGSRVYVEGSIKTREYTDRAGLQKKTTEIQLGKYNGVLVNLDPKNSNTQDAPATAYAVYENNIPW